MVDYDLQERLFVLVFPFEDLLYKGIRIHKF